MKEYMASTLTHEEVKEANARMRDWLSPEDDGSGIQKVAQAATDMIRWRVREGSICRNILTPVQITANDLIPSLTDDDPLYYGEVEPETPGGVVVPLGARTKAWYFYGKRYQARFSRLMTPRFMKDTSQLLTYKTDLRQVFSDNALKDLLALEDYKFFNTINNMLSPSGAMAFGETIPQTGIVQWNQLSQDITLDSVNDALSMMTDSTYGLRPATVVVNVNFAYQLQKWTRDEFGGDLAQEVHLKGWTEREFMGARWLITIKNWLVPNGTMYMFAPQEFIGKTLVLEDTTMHVEKKAFMVEFWAYQQIAQVIANMAGICRCDIVGA